MIKKILPHIFRYILTLVLIYGVYTETGIFTALAIFFISAGLEINDFRINLRNKYINNESVYIKNKAKRFVKEFEKLWSPDKDYLDEHSK